MNGDWHNIFKHLVNELKMKINKKYNENINI